MDTSSNSNDCSSYVVIVLLSEVHVLHPYFHVLALRFAQLFHQIVSMLLPLLALDLHLCFVARAIDRVHFFLTDEFLSGLFAVGVVDVSEIVEGHLQSSFGRNLPVADSDFVVTRIVFGTADDLTRTYVSSQRAYSLKQSDPFLIDGRSIALALVASGNAYASFRRTEFDGPDEAIKGLEVVFG